MAHSNISASQALEWLISGDAILIDVREADEFSVEHIAYAASMPLSSIGELLSDLELPKSRKVIFQCLRGSRGQQACAIVGGDMLAGHDIYNIEGGIMAWQEAGLPIVSAASSSTAAAPSISIFRQVQIVAGALVLIFVLLGLGGVKAAFFIAGLIGAGLIYAGLSGTCKMGELLGKMPWNN